MWTLCAVWFYAIARWTLLDLRTGDDRPTRLLVKVVLPLEVALEAIAMANSMNLETSIDALQQASTAERT